MSRVPFAPIEYHETNMGTAEMLVSLPWASEALASARVLRVVHFTVTSEWSWCFKCGPSLHLQLFPAVKHGYMWPQGTDEYW